MAISRDSYNRYNKWNTTGNSLTGSHTVGTGSNKILIVAVTTQNDGGAPTVTYGGNAMTKFKDSGQNASNQRRYCLFRYNNPASGAANVVVTITNNDRISFVSTSYFGVDLDTPIDVTDSDLSTSGTFTHNLTTTSANEWILSSGNLSSTTTAVSGTASLSTLVALSQDYCNYADSGSGKAAAAYTVVWEGTGNGGGVAAAINPATSTQALYYQQL